MAKGFNGPALGVLLAGSVFVWAGLKGYSIPQTIQDLVTGKKPTGLTQSSPIQSAVTDPTAGVLSGAGLGANTPSGGYDHAGLVKLWTSNGGSASTANNAACHAIQESSGNPKITSSNPDGGENVGLWQLDTKGEGAGYSVSQLQDADTNARITIMKTNNGTNWSAWATPGC